MNGSDIITAMRRHPCGEPQSLILRVVAHVITVFSFVTATVPSVANADSGVITDISADIAECFAHRNQYPVESPEWIKVNENCATKRSEVKIDQCTTLAFEFSSILDVDYYRQRIQYMRERCTPQQSAFATNRFCSGRVASFSDAGAYINREIFEGLIGDLKGICPTSAIEQARLNYAGMLARREARCRTQSVQAAQSSDQESFARRHAALSTWCDSKWANEAAVAYSDRARLSNKPADGQTVASTQASNANLLSRPPATGLPSAERSECSRLDGPRGDELAITDPAAFDRLMKLCT